MASEAEHGDARSEGRLVKIEFPLAPDETVPTWPPASSETMWAEDLGDNRYRIDNSPWYAFGVSYNDIVSVANPISTERLVFDQVIQHKGHSTYRVIVTRTADNAVVEELMAALRARGCEMERHSAAFVAIDVPPDASLSAAYKILQRGEASGIWDFEEGYAHV